MSAQTRPAPLSARPGDDRDDLRVDAPAEVLALLRRLAHESVLVNVSGPDGSSYTTTLWTVDAPRARLGFAADADSPQVQRLLDAQEAVVVGFLDSIKLQFDVAGLVLVRGTDSCALQAALPSFLYRFQRRASFRVRTPERGAPTLRLRLAAQPDDWLALRVLDLSAGGCALAMPPGSTPPAVGTLFEGVVVELDDDTRFTANLRVQHASAPDASGGARLGCALLRLDGGAQRALQRYIDQTQKRRRLLSLD